MGSLARHHLYVCVGIVYIRLILCHSIVSNAFSFYAPYIHAKITVSSDSIDLVNVWLSREREKKKSWNFWLKMAMVCMCCANVNMNAHVLTLLTAIV